MTIQYVHQEIEEIKMRHLDMIILHEKWKRVSIRVNMVGQLRRGCCGSRTLSVYPPFLQTLHKYPRYAFNVWNRERRQYVSWDGFAMFSFGIFQLLLGFLQAFGSQCLDLLGDTSLLILLEFLGKGGRRLAQDDN